MPPHILGILLDDIRHHVIIGAEIQSAGNEINDAPEAYQKNESADTVKGQITGVDARVLIGTADNEELDYVPNKKE